MSERNEVIEIYARLASSNSKYVFVLISCASSALFLKKLMNKGFWMKQLRIIYMQLRNFARRGGRNYDGWRSL